MDISTVIVGLAGFGAAALAVDRHASPVVAKLCFLAAAAVTAGAAIYWGSETTLSPAARIGVTALMSAAIGIALVESWRWATPSPPKHSTTPAPARPAPTSAPETAPSPTLPPSTNGPSVSEILAREQLAELRTRQKAERDAARLAEDQKLQDAENARRRKLSDTATALVDKLRAEYLKNQFGDDWASPGKPQWVPDEWINSRLRERGLDWTYAGQKEGGYSMAPGKSAFEK